jgi:hypothetical protein
MYLKEKLTNMLLTGDSDTKQLMDMLKQSIEPVRLSRRQRRAAERKARK